MKTIRNSNFELLRIFAMLGIMASHMNGYAGLYDVSSDYAVNNVFVSFTKMLGAYGNYIFMLLSGYFLCKKKFKFKNLIKLYLQMWFYSFLMIYILICSKNFTVQEALHSDMIFPVYHSLNWYAVAYILVYGISDFLNLILEKMPAKKNTLPLYHIVNLSLGFRIYLDRTFPHGSFPMAGYYANWWYIIIYFYVLTWGIDADISAPEKHIIS